MSRRRRPLAVAIAWLIALGLALPAAAQPRAEPPPADRGETDATAEPAAKVEPPGPLYCTAEGRCDFPEPFPEGAHVVVAPLDDEVSLGMASFVERVLADLEAGDVLVLDINTFGGRVDAAVRIRDALLAADRRGVRTVAFVNPRAISAGALISLATDVIAVAPGATMGAATPVTQGEGGEMEAAGEKVTSYMRKEMRATAEAQGRSGDIAEAMVDRDLEVAGLSPAGKLLTLDGTEALAWGVASFQADGLDALLGTLGYGEGQAPHTLERVEWSWAEELAGWLSSAALSGLLMTIGMLALMIGLYSGGAPLPLAIGAVCLGVFFFGHHVVDLVGFEELVLVGVGVLLLLIEVFTPGHILPGVLGALCLVAALVLALLDVGTVPLDIQWEMGWVTRALVTVFGAILATGVLVVVAVRALPESPLGQKFILQTALSARAGDKAAAEHETLVGARGVAATDLRPAGRVTVDGRRYDAVAEVGFIARGAPVIVRHGRGFSLVVAPAPGEGDDA